MVFMNLYTLLEHENYKCLIYNLLFQQPGNDPTWELACCIFSVMRIGNKRLHNTPASSPM